MEKLNKDQITNLLPHREPMLLLDELIEITHRISVIFEGKLSEPLNTKNADIAKLGLLMGGKNE